MSEQRNEREERRGWDEKWRHDGVRAVSIAAILIWGGLVALAGTLNFFRFSWWHGWAVFLTGTGVIVLIKALIRALIPEYRRPVGGNLIIGFILLAIGLGELVGWRFIWPIVLIAIGVIILLRAYIRRR